MYGAWWQSGKNKQQKHKLVGPDFPQTLLTLMPGCPGSNSVLSPSPVRMNTHLVVRMSTIFQREDVVVTCSFFQKALLYKQVWTDYWVRKKGPWEKVFSEKSISF